MIPTLNADKYLAECLGAIREQDYGGGVEILLADRGSTDRTLEIAERFGVERVLPNPSARASRARQWDFEPREATSYSQSTPTTSSSAATGCGGWPEPFGDDAVIATEALRWDYRRADHFIPRWSALTGVGDPLALHLGSYVRYSHRSGTWTECPRADERLDGWIRVTLESGRVPTLGANGFHRRALVPAR